MQEKNERPNPFYFMATSPDGWLPPSLTNTLSVQDFLNDIHSHSQSDIITPEFRKNNPYISYHLCNLGNIPLLRAWHNEDMKAVARELIIAPLSHYEDEMREKGLRQDEINAELKKTTYYLISLALRNSSEGDVRELTKIASELLAATDLRKGFNEGQKDAFKAFERWGCQIARYRKPEELALLSERYLSPQKGPDFISLDQEIAYGERSFKDAEQALKLCTDDKEKPKNKKLDFLNTTPDRQGMRLAVEYLIEQHANISRERGYPNNLMNTVRVDPDCYTPLKGYVWATPIIEEMVHLAKDGSIPDLKAVQENQFEGFGFECLYLYENEIYSVHEFRYTHPNRVNKQYALPALHILHIDKWTHGMVSLEKLWPRLEELHHEVMTFPLDRDDAASLMEFYDKVIETIWLLGNLTPTVRGTGKTVEQWFTMAHLQHGLRTPALQLKNPQLDVLNITLPLSLYKQRFFQYFEPESLPRPIAQMLKKQRSTEQYIEEPETQVKAAMQPSETAEIAETAVRVEEKPIGTVGAVETSETAEIAGTTVRVEEKPIEILERQEITLLRQLLFNFSNHIESLEDTPENSNVLAIAEELKRALTGAIDIYAASRPSKKAQETFITSCTEAIESAKELLGRELDWGNYLTNLLKSLANIVIATTNAIGDTAGFNPRYSLFTPVKSPLIPEVEEIETDLNKQFPPANN
ncbi:hypothetical protein [Legionella maioricensis]|uniref:Substrate of the Dot/Icm secretion system n=1 Tax=Legionella maioricensis TaxID=2896528 RepID=A0A9X2CY07_9GAMM|nr:hypothetical protein [Legionella maioricensis]MCL9682960.1 hypothetical protein [Legionella maioricensis]MCL9686308.1 hypothetical protein [Legionella maioricensis]